MSNPYDPNASSNPYGAPQGGGFGQGGDGGYGNPYGQSNPYGNEPPKKTDPVSIIGFVLSLTCCLSIVGAIMGFVGLGRTKGGKRKGRWAAIAASVIGILGSYVGNLQELKEVVALAKKGKIKPTPVTLRSPDEVNKSLEELKAGKILGRVVLDMSSK